MAESASQGEQEQQHLRLPDHYKEGSRIYEELKKSSPSQPAFQDSWRKATEHMQEAARLLRQVDVFSAGEDYREHSPVSLKYVLIPAYQAELKAKTPVDLDDPERNERRVETLQAVHDYMVQFLELCVSLNLGDETAITSCLEMKPGARQDRDAKIAAVKAQRDARTKFEELTVRVNDTKSKGEDDEELEMDHVVALIQLWIQDICVKVPMNLRELGMLKDMIKHQQSSSEAGRGGSSDDRMQQRPHVPLQPITLTKADVERMAASNEGINRADFKLITRGYGPIGAPTMSMDEFAAEEVRKAKEVQAASDAAEKERQRVADDESDAAADAATYKARQWDEYKDDVRRGDGNRYNMG